MAIIRLIVLSFHYVTSSTVESDDGEKQDYILLIIVALYLGR